MVYSCFVLSPVIRVLLTPSLTDNSAKLDADLEASGPHDFTVRFRAVRQGRIHVHCIPLRVRDDREPPLWKERDSTSIIRKSESVKSYYEIRNKNILPPVPAHL